MAEIKSVSEIAAKWARVTPGRTEDYEYGVKAPRRDWAKAAAAAEDTYKTAVITAANAGRYGKGVAKVGSAKWQEKTVAKGVPRWGPGVTMAQPDFEKGFAPFADVIAKTVLPKKYAKGDPRNLERVAVIAKALHDAKVK